MDGIIGDVICGLQAAGFRVRRARPGARIPRITACCEAVGLHRLVARPGGSAEAELFIQVFSPTALGAGECEREAAAVAAAVAGGLETIPACVCQGSECAYDGAGDFFTLRLTMTLPVRLGEGGATPDKAKEPGVILADGQAVATVAQWTATVKQTAEPVYAFGENTPVGISVGEVQYNLTLKGILPAEGQTNLALLEQFSLAVQRGNGTVTYNGCTWREFRQVETETGTTIQAEAAAASRVEE